MVYSDIFENFKCFCIILVKSGLLLISFEISPSQIYVEIERARLTKTLANIKEQSGDVKEAASILQELQVRDEKWDCATMVIVAKLILVLLQTK